MEKRKKIIDIIDIKDQTQGTKERNVRNKEWRDWRKKVLERDNWTCQWSGIKGEELDVHHILNFEKHPELRYNVDNGITLSKDAHKIFHKIYGNENNTREQLQEFLKKPVGQQKFLTDYFEKSAEQPKGSVEDIMEKIKNLLEEANVCWQEAKKLKALSNKLKKEASNKLEKETKNLLKKSKEIRKKGDKASKEAHKLLFLIR